MKLNKADGAIASSAFVFSRIPRKVLNNFAPYFVHNTHKEVNIIKIRGGGTNCTLLLVTFFQNVKNKAIWRKNFIFQRHIFCKNELTVADSRVIMKLAVKDPSHKFHFPKALRQRVFSKRAGVSASKNAGEGPGLCHTGRPSRRRDERSFGGETFRSGRRSR